MMMTALSEKGAVTPEAARYSTLENCRRTFASRTIPTDYIGELSPYPVSPDTGYHCLPTKNPAAEKCAPVTHDDQMTTTFLSDVSEELLVEVENRLSRLDAADGLGAVRYQSEVRDSAGPRKTVVHRHFSSIVTGDEPISNAKPIVASSNNLSYNGPTKPHTDGAPTPTPVATLSLASLVKVPLLTIAVEIAAGKHDDVVFYEGDSAKDIASAFVKKHQLPPGKVLEPLIAHFEKILEEHRSNGPATTDSRQNLTQRPSGGHMSVTSSAEPGKRPLAQSSKSMANSHAGEGKMTVANKKEESRTEGSTGATSAAATSRKKLSVASRYLSPAPKRAPPPPPETFSHSPAISRGSQKLVEQKESAVGHQPAFERLFKHNNPLAASPLPSQEQVDVNSRPSARPSPARAPSPSAVGSRLHQQAALQREKLRALSELEKRRAEAKEMEGATFRPNTNRSNSVSNRHRDPYCGSTPLRKSKPLSTEQIILNEKCTFRPAVNNKSSVAVNDTDSSRSPKIAGGSEVGRHSLQKTAQVTSIAAQSPSRQLSYAASQEDIKKKAIAYRQLRKPSSAARANSAKPLGRRGDEALAQGEESIPAEKRKGENGSTHQWKDVVTRLLESQQQYKTNLDSRKKYLESTDPATGLPLFKPFLGR